MGERRMRLFTAVTFTEEIKDTLVTYMERLQAFSAKGQFYTERKPASDARLHRRNRKALGRESRRGTGAGRRLYAIFRRRRLLPPPRRRSVLDRCGTGSGLNEAVRRPVRSAAGRGLSARGESVSAAYHLGQRGGSKGQARLRAPSPVHGGAQAEPDEVGTQPRKAHLYRALCAAACMTTKRQLRMMPELPLFYRCF